MVISWKRKKKGLPWKPPAMTRPQKMEIGNESTSTTKSSDVCKATRGNRT